MNETPLYDELVLASYNTDKRRRPWPLLWFAVVFTAALLFLLFGVNL